MPRLRSSPPSAQDRYGGRCVVRARPNPRRVVRLADTKNNHQGRYGEAYFHVLATAAGAVATKVEYDMEGVDFFVGLPRELRGIRFPKIEVQVKSVSNLQPSSNGTVWRFRDLNEDQYNNLAGPDSEFRASSY